MDPLEPFVVTAPEVSSRNPELPLTELPELRTTIPVPPAVVDAPEPTTTAPVDVGDEPLITDIEPDRPPTATPDAIKTDPLVPLPVVPELNSRAPEDPTETAFAESTYKGPEDDTDPPPVRMDTSPPAAVVSDVEPPVTKILPPEPLKEAPTNTLTDPERPLEEKPEASTT